MTTGSTAAGSAPAGPQIAALYRYPVKGLSPEPMRRVALEVGGTFPLDRAFAIENGPGRFDPENPRYLPKIHFLMLMRDERLATLETHLDDATSTLTILRDGRQVARGNLATAIGRQLIEQFLAAYMKDSMRGAPKVVAAPGHSFSDMSAKCVHIVNLASVRDLERIMGKPIDPLRFRPNIMLDGVPAWEELGWLDKTIRVGSLELAVFHRTQRCDATNVDPANGHRDMAIPAVLQRTFGHSDFGIYAKVAAAGALAVGDRISVG
ncbi:MAG: MOSC domain-containing protein [Hyphomicrobiaceae bacterium]|nr:MOSC domain-containing protein [Hyphomicrobiaceae bacterium]